MPAHCTSAGIAKFLAAGALLLCIGCTTRLAPDAPAAINPGNATSKPVQSAGVICPENTQIRFVGSALLNSHEGTFTRFAGQLTYPVNDSGPGAECAQLSAQVETGSVQTQIPLLTRHIKDADFLDTDKYPLATFVSRQIASAPSANSTHLVTGDFTIHGITKTIAFPAAIDIRPASIHFKASFTIRQSDFGMNASRNTVDDVPVTVDAMVPRN